MNALMWEWISQNTRTTPGRSKRTDLEDRKSTRLNSSHSSISYAVFCLKKKMQIAADESVRSLADLSRLARAEAAYIVNLKITKSWLVDALYLALSSLSHGFGLMIVGMV